MKNDINVPIFVRRFEWSNNVVSVEDNDIIVGEERKKAMGDKND